MSVSTFIWSTMRSISASSRASLTKSKYSLFFSAERMLRENSLRSASWNTWGEQGREVTGPGGLSDAGDLVLPITADARGLIEAGIPPRNGEGGPRV